MLVLKVMSFMRAHRRESSATLKFHTKGRPSTGRSEKCTLNLCLVLRKVKYRGRMMKWWVKKGGCCRGRAKELLAGPEDGTADGEVSRELAVQAAPNPQSLCLCQ